MLHRSRREVGWRRGAPSTQDAEGVQHLVDSGLSFSKVAFIVPAKNEAGNIEGVLESIFAQRGVECEVVVVDNGSTDDTVWRASNYGVKIVRCDATVSDCRMAGAAASESPTIFFVDADQRLDPETAKRCVREFDDPAVSAIVVPERPYEPHTWLERVTGAEREIFEAAGRGIPRVFRRSRYLQIGGHPAAVPFGEDYALLSKLSPEEIRTADTIIYHRELTKLTTLLKKYFNYGKRMATAPTVGAIFTERAGEFVVRAMAYALRSPFLAAGAVAVKIAKFVALRTGYAVGSLEAAQARNPRPHVSFRQWLGVGVVALAIAALMDWRLLATPGILIIGDHVSVPADYWKHILGTWDRFEHGGTANANLSDSPYFSLLGALAMVLGAGIADKALIASFFVVSIVAATALLVRSFGLGLAPSFVLGVLYTFNPWTAARLAAGHTQILMGCAMLPLILMIWRTPGRRSMLLAALGIAVEMCLNLQVALLGLAMLVAFGRQEQRFLRDLRDGAICAAVAFGMSLWWILPLLGTHGGNAGHTGLENVLSYTQRTDIGHTLTLRSYWWPAFSDGLYGYGSPLGAIVVAIGMAAIIAVEIAVLLSARWLSAVGRAGAVLWAAVSLVLIVAHAFPVLYWELLRLPFATLYRDPDKLVPLSLIGIIVAAGDLASRFAWKNRFGIPIACAAIACITLPWWSSGDLRGNVLPQVVRDGSIEASAWLSKQKGTDLVLWWPVGPYVRFSWYPAGGQDPMRYWSHDPMLNPYYDPAYDASPATSDFLYALESNVPKRNVPFLGALLSTYGIRYVAVRNFASTTFTNFPMSSQDFDAVRDLRKIKSFGDTDIYQNLAWRPGHYVIGHYGAMLTGDFVPMLSLDPGFNADEIVRSDANPTAASYEYVDIDRPFERGLTTYRYESNAPYDAIIPPGAAPAQSLEDLTVSCATCDVLLVRSNANVLHVGVNGASATPTLLYADLPAWKSRWRAFSVTNANTISITTGDRLSSVYDAVMVSRQSLNAAMQKSFDEVRHHWPTYVADSDALDMHAQATRLQSDRLGPIVETDSRKWQASVVGSGLAPSSLTFYWWSNGERQKSVELACNQTSCTGSVDLSPGFQRLSLNSPSGAKVMGLTFSSGKPPLFDNNRVDGIPGQMDAATNLLMPSSHNDGWSLSCLNGVVTPSVGNGWATLYATGRAVVNCTTRYAPDSLERTGVVVSSIVFGVVILVLLVSRRPKSSRVHSRDAPVELPIG